jgi:dTDP-4-amino-4,6-dideoxygalactose transaminase
VGNFGAASIFSFQFGKPFTTGQGGMVTFTDRALAAAVDELIRKEGVKPQFRHAASLGVQRRLFRWFVRPWSRRVIKRTYDFACRRGWLSGSEPTVASLLGHSEGFLRLCTRGQARAGLTALKHYPAVMDGRIQSADWMTRRLTDEGIRVERPPPATMPVHLRLPVWVEGKRRILAQASEENVDLAGWYASPGHPLRGQALLDLDYDPKTHPAAETAFAQVVTLPTYPRLTLLQLDHMIRVLREGAAASLATS